MRDEVERYKGTAERKIETLKEQVEDSRPHPHNSDPNPKRDASSTPQHDFDLDCRRRYEDNRALLRSAEDKVERAKEREREAPR